MAGAESIAALERGREFSARMAWRDAHGSLLSADDASPLGARDLELLATSAYMLGLDDEYLGAMGRAHRAYLGDGEGPRAVRCAFWMGVHLIYRGDFSRATGWFARAERLLEREAHECVERGYLLIPLVFRHVAGGDHDAAGATAGEAAAIGERFGDRDLVALAGHEHGHALVRQGRAEEGLRLVDEVMVAVTGGELSPLATGLIYCNTIAFCRDVYEVRRAREWTAALTEWCDEQPDMIAHTGVCLVHRAEVMELQGAWQDALEEARRASERLSQGRGTGNEAACGEALYRQGELHRLRGELRAAEEMYREASRCGREPLPGLALLRLARGKRDAAAAAIRRAVAETSDPMKRARLLSAQVEISLAIGDLEEAERACRALIAISERQRCDALEAMSDRARGAVQLAGGDVEAALVALRRAWHVWHELDAPYEAARARVLIALACRALGDEDGAALELGSARAAFERLAAAPDLAYVDSLAGQPADHGTHGLTKRELEVLRLVAAGKSNREIAAELVISEHTAARHLQNIFAKLGVSSRTAASAIAFERELV